MEALNSAAGGYTFIRHLLPGNLLVIVRTTELEGKYERYCIVVFCYLNEYRRNAKCLNFESSVSVLLIAKC